MKLVFEGWNEKLIPDYKAALRESGFVHIKNYLSQQEVSDLLVAQAQTEKKWLASKQEEIFGVPIIYGDDLDGNTIIQRSPFASLHTAQLHESGLMARLETIREIVGENFRIGEKENDGVVFNHYLKSADKKTRKKLGWHTDSGRSFWSLQKPEVFYNIGIHLDDCPKSKGGLRLLLNSHEQSISQMLFRKLHFIDHKPDKLEYCVETEIGDLTIHDGRIWHRVAESAISGENSRRRVIYFPFITGEYKEKTKDSKAPIYLVILQKANKIMNNLLQ